MKKRWMAALALTAVVAVTAACGGKKAEGNENPEGVQEETAAEDAGSSGYESKVIKLGSYKGIKAEAVSTEVTEEELQAEINALLNVDSEEEKQDVLEPEPELERDSRELSH